MSAPRPRSLASARAAGVALLLLGTGLSGVHANATTQTPGDSPCPTVGSDLTVALDIPGRGEVVQLGRTPVFTIRALVDGDLDDPVTQVTLYADGARLADAVPAPTADPTATHRLHTRAGSAWSYATSAPPGRHTVTACATTAAGRTASARTTVLVHRPAPRATVVAPQAQRLSAGDAAALTAVTPAALTFRRTPRMSVGSVVVAAPSTMAPDGLLRRVTGIDVEGTTTVVRTTPAALTDVFWQADIDVHRPLRTATEPDSPTLSWDDTMAAGPNLNGAKVNGTLALGGPAAYTADLVLDLHARIDTGWSWTPTPITRVVAGEVGLSGTTSATANATFAGSGELEIYADPDGKRQIAYPAIELSRALPVWVRPTATLTLHAKAALTDALTLHASAATTSAAGFRVADGVVTPVSDVALAGRADDVPTTGPATAGSARLDARIAVQLRADGTAAARAQLVSGFATSAAPGCPGLLRVDAFASTGATGSALLEPGLTDPASGPAVSMPLRTDPYDTCTPPITG